MAGKQRVSTTIDTNLALERGATDVVAELTREIKAGRPPRTHGGVVGQVWRGGSGRQA